MKVVITKYINIKSRLVESLASQKTIIGDISNDENFSWNLHYGCPLFEVYVSSKYHSDFID
jgi:hypothetical protein